MNTKSRVGFLIAGAGGLLAQVASAAHTYGPVAQTGGFLRALDGHPVLSSVIRLWILAMALIAGAVVVAALIRPTAR